MSLSTFVRTLAVSIFSLLALASSSRARQHGPPPGPDDVKAWARETFATERRSHLRAIRKATEARARESRAGVPVAEWPGDAPFTRASDAFSTSGDVVAAQEIGHWQPGFSLPTLDEYPESAIEFRGELVVSGILRMAGQRQVRGIARWTAYGWEPLGEGVNPASALANFGGRLIAASWFGPVSAWDGSSWTELPASPIFHIGALEVRGGVLYAAGYNPDGRGGEWGRVASFDGVRWTILGEDFDLAVHALGFFRGELIAGGSFSRTGATPCQYVARWDGTRWSAMGAGIDPAEHAGIWAIQEYRGKLIAGGWLGGVKGVSEFGLAVWDGTTWAPLAGAPAASVHDMLVMNGKLHLLGYFAGVHGNVAVWDGSTFESTPDPLWGWVLDLTPFGGRLAAVGAYMFASDRMFGAAVHEPDGWRMLLRWEGEMRGLAHDHGAGEVYCAAVYRGDLIIGGAFNRAGDAPGWKELGGVARWDGRSWQTPGEGFGSAHALAMLAVGEDLIVAGGNIYPAWDEGPIHGVGRWDGARWHRMGLGLQGLVFTLAEYHGRIYAGGEFRILASGEQTTLAAWDGVEWSAIPGAPNVARYNKPRVSALEVSDGILYVGGNFEGAGSVVSRNVAAWDGRWHSMGMEVGGEVRALEHYRGDLYAGGYISLPDALGFEGLMRWDGSSWHSMGIVGGGVLSLAIYDEKLLVGGFVDRLAPGSGGLAAWDGEHWSGFGRVKATPYAFVTLGSELWVGGRFSGVGEQTVFGIARWSREPVAPPDPGETPAPAQPTVPETAAGLYLRGAVITGSQAQLSYSLPEAGRARIDLFDVRGARIAALLDQEMPAGEATLDWDAGAPAPFPGPGIYFARLGLNGRMATARVVFVR